MSDFDRRAAREIKGVRLARVMHKPGEGNHQSLERELWAQVLWVHPEPDEAAQQKFPPHLSWCHVKSIPNFVELFDAFAEKNPIESAGFQEAVDAMRDDKHHGFEFLTMQEPRHLVFSEEEVQLMRLAMAKHDRDWQKIGEEVNRTAIDCQAYYNQHVVDFAPSNAQEEITTMLEVLSKQCAKETLKELCRTHGLGVTGTKDTMINKLREYCFKHSIVSEKEKKVLAEVFKRHGYDFATLRQEMEDRGYVHGIREMENIVLYLYPTPSDVKMGEIPPQLGIRSNRVDSLQAQIVSDHTAYGASAVPGRTVSRERVGKAEKRNAEKAAVESAKAPLPEKRASVPVAPPPPPPAPVRVPGKRGRRKNLDKPREIPTEPPDSVTGRRHEGGQFVEYRAVWKKTAARPSITMWLDVVDLVERYPQRCKGDADKLVTVQHMEKYDSEHDLGEELAVLAVVDDKVEGGEVKYKIMWTDYPDAFCNWEPESNLGRDAVKIEEYLERKKRTGSGHVPNPCCASNRPAAIATPTVDLPESVDAQQEEDDLDEEVNAEVLLENTGYHDDEDHEDVESEDVGFDDEVKTPGRKRGKVATPKSQASGGRSAGKMAQCDVCNGWFKERGMKRHKMSKHFKKPMIGVEPEVESHQLQEWSPQMQTQAAPAPPASRKKEAPAPPAAAAVSLASPGKNKKAKKDDAATATSAGGVKYAELLAAVSSTKEWQPICNEVTQIAGKVVAAEAEGYWRKLVANKTYPGNQQRPDVDTLEVWMTAYGPKLKKWIKKDRRLGKTAVVSVLGCRLLAPACFENKAVASAERGRLSKLVVLFEKANLALVDKGPKDGMAKLCAFLSANVRQLREWLTTPE